MKDNFSSNSANYAKYRPVYPDGIYKLIWDIVPIKDRVWDCGTGNGQVALELSKLFKEVFATDISSNQLANSPNKKNIQYSVQPAEKTNFPEKYFDLITVAQAIHWFNFYEFYKEVKRCLKPGGYLFVLGYGLFRSNKETEEVILNFYNNIIGPYWDPERKYLDEEYRTIPFPFKELKVDNFVQEVTWSFEHLTGYLKTWSAVKHYIEQEGSDPLDIITEDLFRAFGKEGKIKFPISIRIGRID